MGQDGSCPNRRGKKERWETSEGQQCEPLLPRSQCPEVLFPSRDLVNIHKYKCPLSALLLLFPSNGKTITCLIQKTTFKVLYWERVCQEV